MLRGGFRRTSLTKLRAFRAVPSLVCTTPPRHHASSKASTTHQTEGLCVAAGGSGGIGIARDIGGKSVAVGVPARLRGREGEEEREGGEGAASAEKERHRHEDGMKESGWSQGAYGRHGGSGVDETTEGKAGSKEVSQLTNSCLMERHIGQRARWRQPAERRGLAA